MKAFLQSRQTQYGTYLAVYVAVVVAVLAAVNFLANRYNKSYDATSNKRYSLSDQTKKIARDLKQDLKLRYFDKTSSFQANRDLLDLYADLSTKLTVEYIDPDKKPALAKAAGIRNYGTLQVVMGDRVQEARSVTEEEITSAMVRALKGGERTVCFAGGYGERDLDNTEGSGYSAAKETVERNNYKARTISLLQSPQVPQDCTVLVVAGPRNEYVQPTVQAMKTFVEGGGSALFLLDPPLKLQREEIAENAGLVALLGEWGVTVEKDLVVDMSGIGQIFGLSEAVPLVTSYQSHPIVREMKNTASAFSLARSLDAKPAGNANAEKLFETSDNSFATTNLTAAEIKPDPSKDKKGPLTLGAAGVYRTGKPNNEGRFVVVGSSGWAANNLLRFNGNRDLFLNMLNWLSADEDLISIRPKDPEDRRITMNRSQMAGVLYGNVIGIPLIIIAAGVFVWSRRR